MPKIRVTAEAEAAIRSQAIGNAFKGVKPNADGSFDIHVEWETLDSLYWFGCESYSEAIIRLAATANKLAN